MWQWTVLSLCPCAVATWPRANPIGWMVGIHDFYTVVWGLKSTLALCAMPLNQDQYQHLLTCMAENLDRHWIFDFHRMGFALWRPERRTGVVTRKRIWRKTKKVFQLLRHCTWSAQVKCWWIWSGSEWGGEGAQLWLIHTVGVMTKRL